MDYKEEQTNEIEALDSIYCGDMEIISTRPLHKFVIPIKSEEYEPDGADGLSCSLRFEYTPRYPEEPPGVDVLDGENLREDDERLLREHILREADENLGTVMIFTLVSSAQEWLNTKWDEIKKQKEEAATKKAKEVEEAERKRFEGTRVTVESFMQWKEQFDAQFNAHRNQEKEDKEGRKLTGKELFYADKTLIESDLKFLENGDSIKVDESLFQDLEELDLAEINDLDDEDDS
ncbi:RWD domain-containing protein 1 [Bacillus rossius redtenbacheri]|uniref:RWD domain-containing protein 1 n=1 Tax=Bacillus rossius redtenbacheri TaxID=93214 RepID=UPI002FDE7DA4